MNLTSKSRLILDAAHVSLAKVEELRLVHVAALDTDVNQDKYDTAWAWIHAQDDVKELGRQYKRACKVEGRDPQDWKQQLLE